VAKAAKTKPTVQVGAGGLLGVRARGRGLGMMLVANCSHPPGPPQHQGSSDRCLGHTVWHYVLGTVLGVVIPRFAVCITYYVLRIAYYVLRIAHPCVGRVC